MTIKIGEGTWIDPTAVLIGNIEIGQRCFIGPGAVLRADLGKITIGDETSIQDNVVIHAEGDIKIGSRVTIGHGAVIHGNVEDEALIGMNAVVSINAKVGKGTIVGELALVPINTAIPPESVAIGIPAKVIKKVTPELRERVMRGAKEYVELARKYQNGEINRYARNAKNK